MPQTTTALVVEKADGRFLLQDVTLGSIRPDEALVEIQATGICHTDLSCATGMIPAQLPAVLGHEGSYLSRH
jgi:Zn-dependent alcohol dehydrogenase